MPSIAMKQSPAALRAFTASCTGVLSLPVSFHSEKTPLYPNRPTRTRRPPGERPTKFNWRGLLPIELAPEPQLSPTSPLVIGKNRLLPSEERRVGKEGRSRGRTRETEK